MEVDESVDHIIQTLKNLTTQDNGKFLSYEGTEIPW